MYNNGINKSEKHNTQLIGPLISDDEIKLELKKRKSTAIYKTIKAKNRTLVAEKVKIEEQDGWRVAKKNSKSTRMKKPKPSDQQLEDEVWSILAQMGFKEMSSGRNFRIDVGERLNPRQIDVLAKDDESIVIVECTQSEKPCKKRMSPLIEKILAIRENLYKSINKINSQGPKPKVRFVIASRNVIWSDNDRQLCKEKNISVLTDPEIEYYLKLVQHLKHAARYQLLGHLFEGQKIPGLERKVVATRSKMGGDIFYSFLIKPDDLLKIAYVGHKGSRDSDNIETYQRLLGVQRLKKIANYINGGGKFPTNIVVNLKGKNNRGLKFDIKDNLGDVDLGVLHLPPFYASAWVIDGQHRLYGYSFARNIDGFNSDTSVLPVLAYENLNSDKERNLFIDINSKQVKVNSRLLVELYADLHWESTNPEEAFNALLSRISSQLNNDVTSPLQNRMVLTGKRKTHFRCLTQPSILDGLKNTKLLGRCINKSIVPGPLSTANGEDYNANLKKGIAVISDCLNLFASEMKFHWKLGDATGGYLCTNNGIRALFYVLDDICDYVCFRKSIDLYLLDSSETFNELKPYLLTLLEYFKTASTQDIQGIRRIGSSLANVRKQAYHMEAQIQNKYENFKPQGLDNYLNSHDEEGTARARSLIMIIQKRIFDYVISVLKEIYGTQNKNWWVKGIPPKIRIDCSKRWEEKNREGEEEGQLLLQNYVEISIFNWDNFKNVISLDAKDKESKRKNTMWISKLNTIRNKVTHPEQGHLDTDQVAFVEEIDQKVKRFFPD